MGGGTFAFVLHTGLQALDRGKGNVRPVPSPQPGAGALSSSLEGTGS